ncbi:MAG: hypothetical protein ABIO05_04370 [Ferruginibacter sp.]
MGLFNNTNKTGTNKGGGLRRMYEASKPTLNLSADQETRIEQALEELKGERKNFKNQGDGNKEEMQTARQQARKKIMDILNPSQQKLWHENAQKWKEEK